MKKLIVVFVAFFAACATNAKESSKNHSSVNKDLSIQVKSSAKEFAVQLDGGNEVMMTKFATDNTFSVTLQNVVDGEHQIECINEETNRQVQCQAVTINKFAKCAYSEDKLLLKFSSPVTMADEGCDKGIKYWKITGNHRSALLEHLNPILTATDVSKIIDNRMASVTVDVECLGSQECRGYLAELRDNGVIVRAYINPLECPIEDWVFSSRPLLKSLCETVRSKYPNYFMKDVSGQPIYTWVDPKGGFHLQMLNISTTSATYKINNVDKTWGQYWVDYWAGVLAQYPGLYGGGEFDNANAYCSYITGIYLKDEEGNKLDQWQTDRSCRDGYRNIIKYAREKFGKNFIISVRSKSDFFSDIVDAVTYESPLIDDTGSSEDLQPFTTTLKLMGIADKTPGVTVTHCEEDQCNKYKNLSYSNVNRQESGYTFAMMANHDNVLYAFDRSGQNGHGEWMSEGESTYLDMGKSLADTEYPFLLTLEELDEVTLLNDGATSFPVFAGNVICFNYVENGTQGKSTLTYLDSNGVTNRWFDGRYVCKQVNFTGYYVFSFLGEGEGIVSEVRVFDPTQTTTNFMFKHEYEGATFWRNTSTTIARVIPGTNISVAPTEGHVVLK